MNIEGKQESARGSEVLAMLGVSPLKADTVVRPGLGQAARPEGFVVVMQQKSNSAMAPSHRVNGEMAVKLRTAPPAKMLKASLPKGESDDARKKIGECLDFARRAVGWTVDQLAREIGRDSKQVARWMRGEESTQLHTVFTVAKLKVPFLIALSRLARDCDEYECEEDTTLRFKRRA